VNITISNLNQTEHEIHEKLTALLKENSELKIIEAASLCKVSSSKVSKYVKKLGFDNFKQYKLHFSGQVPLQKKPIMRDEIVRIKDFLEDFDQSLIEQFLAYFSGYTKIILYGLGPTFIFLEYFAYKLNFVTNKKIFVTQEEDSINRLADENTLLTIFSVTGAFAKFDNIYNNANKQGATVLLILEEYNPNVYEKIDNIIYLTKSIQNPELLPYEKTRTIFFIFIEAVIAQLVKTN